ncbi:hypothetical protein [Halomonas sp. M20]|uniref:hypothetical protein n=1 Tax=Halomonas sp. M20 TaxID=2763264 RepID=UPI001D0ACEA7|nr:hypothetical protein [Halomonas sp. M20]
MATTKQSVIGDIGEYIAQKHLEAEGYELVRFGCSSSSKEIMHKVTTIPNIPDQGIGYSWGLFGFNYGCGLQTEWIDPVAPRWADHPQQLIKNLAIECRDCSSCAMRDNLPDQAPCANIQAFLEKDWLDSIEPYNPFFHATYDNNGLEIKLKGHRLVTHCLDHFTDMLLGKHKQVAPYGKDFILTNMLISDYVMACWRKHMKTEALPYPGDEIMKARARKDTESEERMKQANRTAMKKFPAGHPGRYDFIGNKNGECIAFEIKVNSSKPSYWQKVRLGLLQKYGHKAKVIYIKMNKAQIGLATKGTEPECDRLEVTDKIDTSNVHIPSDAEFVEMLNFKE